MLIARQKFKLIEEITISLDGHFIPLHLFTSWQAENLKLLEKQNQDLSAKLERAVEHGGLTMKMLCIED